ncbi:hypothetical protein BT69DRAFT_1280601 [Atractiella rhizophila]|nr:hypothetical protein BT69DRAFT_1280601 [Atractiella rhizophila]
MSEENGAKEGAREYKEMIEQFRSLLSTHLMQRSSLLQTAQDLYLLQSYRSLTPISVSAPSWSDPLLFIRCRKSGRVSGEESWFLPIPLNTELSVSRISGIFKALEGRDVQMVTMAIAETDSSVVYYEVRKGIVAPKEVKDVF